MQAALDTNLLVYAEGFGTHAHDVMKSERVRKLLAELPDDEIAVPVQVLGELYRVLAEKAGWPRNQVRKAILSWRDQYPAIDTTAAVMMAAVDLAAEHRLSVWDAVVLAAVAEAGCRILLSEDLQDGFTWRGLTVVNPLAAVQHPLLEALLASGRQD